MAPKPIVSKPPSIPKSLAVTCLGSQNANSWSEPLTKERILSGQLGEIKFIDREIKGTILTLDQLVNF